MLETLCTFCSHLRHKMYLSLSTPKKKKKKHSALQWISPNHGYFSGEAALLHVLPARQLGSPPRCWQLKDTIQANKHPHGIACYRKTTFRGCCDYRGRHSSSRHGFPGRLPARLPLALPGGDRWHRVPHGDAHTGLQSCNATVSCNTTDAFGFRSL